MPQLRLVHTQLFRVQLITSIFVALFIGGPVQAQSERGNPQVFVYKLFTTCVGTRLNLTTFISQDLQGFVTALHGVAGCEDISATNPLISSNDLAKRFEDLQVTQVSFEHDLAVLSSPELVSYLSQNPNVGLRTATSMTALIGSIKVIGFPLNVTEHVETNDIQLRPGGIVPLTSRIPLELQGDFASCGSPSINSNVLDLEGTIRPGESGAPVLNSADEVIGVGLGGLGEGTSDIVWAAFLSEVTFEDVTFLQDALEQRGARICATNRFARGDSSTPYLQGDTDSSIIAIYDSPSQLAAGGGSLDDVLGCVMSSFTTPAGSNSECEDIYSTAVGSFVPKATVISGTKVQILGEAVDLDPFSQMVDDPLMRMYIDVLLNDFVPGGFSFTPVRILDGPSANVEGYVLTPLIRQ
ncbi:MAG: trypsin-like peptidase domain-containing protein [Deinococcota bacterium]